MPTDNSELVNYLVHALAEIIPIIMAAIIARLGISRRIINLEL